MQLTHSVYIATIPNTIVQEDGAGNGRGGGVGGWVVKTSLRAEKREFIDH